MFNQKWNKRVQQDKVWYKDIAKSLESILMGSGDAETVLQFKLYELVRLSFSCPFNTAHSLKPLFPRRT
jgi:hypothetical protein